MLARHSTYRERSALVRLGGGVLPGSLNCGPAVDFSTGDNEPGLPAGRGPVDQVLAVRGLYATQTAAPHQRITAPGTAINSQTIATSNTL